jgi:hypothetical protein
MAVERQASSVSYSDSGQLEEGRETLINMMGTSTESFDIWILGLENS